MNSSIRSHIKGTAKHRKSSVGILIEGVVVCFRLITVKIRPSAADSRKSKKNAIASVPVPTAMDENNPFDECSPGAINPPTPIDLLDRLMSSAQAHTSSPMNFVSSSTQPSLADESLTSESSDSSIQSEKTIQTDGQRDADVDSISSTFARSQRHETINIQPNSSPSQLVSSISMLQSSITQAPTTTSMSSSTVTVINGNLPSPRPPPSKRRSANAEEKSHDRRSDLLKDNRENQQEHLADRPVHTEHLSDPQPAANRRSHRSRKRPARFDSPDSEVAPQAIENGEVNETR